MSAKKALVGSALVAAAIIWARRKSLKPTEEKSEETSAKKRAQETYTGEIAKSKTSRYWAIIIDLLEISNDPHAQKLLLGMLGCAGVFAVLDGTKARTGGELFKTLFDGTRSEFRRLLIKNIILSFGIVLAHKGLANLVSSLSRHWQQKLILKIHDKYFAGSNYYRIHNKVEFAQERICTDSQQLTRDLALVACDAINASLNFTFFGSQVFFLVRQVAGIQSAIRTSIGPMVYAVTAWSVVSILSPNFASTRKKQRQLETEYKQGFARFGRSTEAVACYKGEEFEEKVLKSHFDKLTDFVSKARSDKFWSEILSQYVQKYCTHSVMLGLVMAPFFKKNSLPDSHSGKSSQTLYQIRYLADLIYMEMLSLGSFARLLTTTRQLGGIVERVGVLVEELDEMSDVSLPSSATALGEGVQQLSYKDDATPHGTLIHSTQNEILFENVEIETPAGHPLVKGLSFSVKPGISIIICGPNGAGKSSIFRCLGGLWPIKAGKIIRPAGADGNGVGLHSSVFYLPQKPYTVFGTLAENVTYPNMAAAKDVSDTDFIAVLRLVELEGLYLEALKNGTLNEPTNWEQRLSLGEQQRLAMARLFWQRPVFAVLDECTSAVSLKMERRLFRVCRQLGISLITISHRPALIEFHDYMLVLDGAGGYRWTPTPTVPTDQNNSLINSSVASSMSLSDLKGSVPLDRLVARLERSGSIMEFNQVMSPNKKKTGFSNLPSEVSPKTGSSEKIHYDSALSRKDMDFTVKLLMSLVNQPKTKQHFAALLGVVILKTSLSNTIAHLNGQTIKLLMQGDKIGFLKLVLSALGLGLGQAVLIPGLDALEESLAMLWRKFMTAELLDKYFQNQNYYRMSQSYPGIQADQVIVEDVEKLSSSIANLWTEAAKPAVDFLWFNSGVFTLTGWEGLSWLGMYMVSGSWFLRMVRPDLASLIAEKERLDGEFSSAHSKIAANSESIAFLDGGKAERAVIELKLENKLNHQMHQKRVEHMYGVADEFVSVFLPQNAAWILSMLYKERVTSAGKYSADENIRGDLTHDLRYLGTVVSQSFSSLGTLVELTTKWESTRGHLSRVCELFRALDHEEHIGDRSPTSASRMTSTPDKLSFNHVDVATPGGEKLLVHNLNFNVDASKDRGLMIAGPTGSGKSAILRVIHGLWNPGSGSVSADSRFIHYVPTKPYTCEGCLADQVTYPVKAELADTESITKALQAVKVSYLIDRESLFDKFTSAWDMRLSLGEQQRIAIARLLFRGIDTRQSLSSDSGVTGCAKPGSTSPWRYALLDECTSAVALDGEEEIYSMLCARGIRVVTATSKPWLQQFHNIMIQLNEDACYELTWTADSNMPRDSSVRLPDIVYTDKRQSAEVVNTENPFLSPESSRSLTDAYITADESEIRQQSESSNGDNMEDLIPAEGHDSASSAGVPSGMDVHVVEPVGHVIEKEADIPLEHKSERKNTKKKRR